MLKTRFNKKIALSNNSNLRFSVVRRRFFIFSNHKKGIALVIVLSTLLVVACLTTAILSLITSHTRFTYHQTSRIQAYYAAMAGINYALEQLRTGNCTAGSPCIMPPFASGDFKPASIVGNSVSITITPAGLAGCPSPPAPTGGACVSATADYTYTP